MTPNERVQRLRKRHRIDALLLQDGRYLCRQDLVRVHPIKVGYRHDVAEMEALNKQAAGGTGL